MTHVSYPIPVQGGSLARPTAFVTQMIVRVTVTIVGELRQRRAMRELRELDDRMLADIGIGRADIEPAARLGRRGLGSFTSRL